MSGTTSGGDDAVSKLLSDSLPVDALHGVTLAALVVCVAACMFVILPFMRSARFRRHPDGIIFLRSYVSYRLTRTERARSRSRVVLSQPHVRARRRSVVDTVFALATGGVLVARMLGVSMPQVNFEHGPCAVPSAIAIAARQSASTAPPRASRVCVRTCVHDALGCAPAVSDISVLALGLDLLAGLSNPFADHKPRVRKYYLCITVRVAQLSRGERLT